MQTDHGQQTDAHHPQERPEAVEFLGVGIQRIRAEEHGQVAD